MGAIAGPITPATAPARQRMKRVRLRFQSGQFYDVISLVQTGVNIFVQGDH